MRAVMVGLVVGGALLAASSARAQSIKPRVMIMVDTSGSMSEHFTDNSTTGGDGSTYYSDNVLTRDFTVDKNLSLYVGAELGAVSCTAPPSTLSSYDGINSRIFAAKQALTNVINGSGDIDWGLMRYSGSVCATGGTFNARTCSANGQCRSGTCTAAAPRHCTCTNDGDCSSREFCVGGICGTDSNLCKSGADYGDTDTRGISACAYHNNDVPLTFQGSCGTSAGAGGVGTACGTPMICYSDADCGGAVGSCVALGGTSAAKVCSCNTGFTCPATYMGTTGFETACDTNKHCVYNGADCVSDGGFVLVNPATQASTAALPYADGIEIFTAASPNPELRANGSTPLAGAARSATAWYNSVIATDPKAACRPYVLVQMTDGVDTCDQAGSGTGDTTNGPVAAAAAFVAATTSTAKVLNKVYVIGLAFGGSAGPLAAIAKAGGTGFARLANSQQDIEAALADIVSSSVLHEVCNNADDNCNGLCDEDFPGVAVTNVNCPNRPASTCDNGLQGQCLATGTFQCSSDQLSQVCVTPVCTAQAGGTISNPSMNTMRIGSTVGVGAGNVGQMIFVSGSTKIANNGGFLISAVAGANVDVTNPGVVVPDASSVTYAIPPTQGKGTPAAAGGNVTLTVTTGSTNGLTVGATIFVAGAGNAGNNGQFTISAVTANTITYGNVSGVTSATPIVWAVDICKGVETCNGLDDDCDGIIDNCGGSTPGSCCTSACPACAKAPFIETCNNCDDDCDGVIDNHLVDTGLSCGNNVGDCAGGLTQCCSADPNLPGNVCPLDHVNDKIYCRDGNPGFPVSGADLCDGTDDNCNGVANDEPPLACFTDANGTLPGGKDGVGACHHGIQQCTTTPLGPGTPPCPVGWPAGKTCPNPAPTYGACQGLVLPHPEFCDGIDNDCNGTVDDNPTDAWIGTACCSTGNLADCDNTLTGTRCKRGTWVCSAGAKTCVNSIAKTTEVCNMIDDDCNGAIDDLPGIGAPCTGTGIYTGGECKAAMKCVATNMPPQCQQTVGPVMETCNGKDDNCNGQIDDNNPPLAVNPLPGVGVPCMVPMPPTDKPPCKAGATVCVAGNIECQGAVGPMPNQCNGISTDCTGNPNTNGNCPSGFQCYQGNCVAPCEAGEFPCPGGYACDFNTTQCDANGNHNGCCVPDACAQKTCPLGYNCQLDAQGNANCVDPCMSVTCPPTYICKLGACVDGSCRTQGCPDGEICVAQQDNSFACQPDPCANVMCDSNQFCQQGVCVGACAGPCPNNQYCDKGQCVPDPCAHTPCIEGQVCRVSNGVGVCVENQCQFGCNIGQACCGGECVADQCDNLHCPEDTHCTLTPDCNATCETNPQSPKDQIVGAGGGGFGCAVAGHASESSSLAWLVLIAGALLLRRRRAVEVSR